MISKTTRREFFKRSGSVVAGSIVLPQIVSSSAFASARQFESFNGSEWPVLKHYDQEHTYRIALPIGGIGTDTVSLGGRGNLQDWEIMSRPAKGYNPGSGTSMAGELGAYLGFPDLMISGIIAGNIFGVLTGEWEGVGAKPKRIMVSGISVLALAIIILGLSMNLV